MTRRRITPRPWIVVALLALFGAAVRGQSVPEFRVEAEYIDRPEALYVGERALLTLVTEPADFPVDRILHVRFEPDQELWHLDRNWHLAETPEAQAESGAGQRWRAQIRPYRVGQLTLPAITVRLRLDDGTTTETVIDDATLDVASIIPEGAETVLLPLRDPVDIPFDWTWVYIILGALVIVLALAYLIARWWTRRGATVQAPVEPPLPPGLWALRELDQRSALSVCRTGPPKIIFTHVSEVIRLYLQRRYGFAAIDMTTLECLRALHDHNPGAQVERWVQEFLDECDMVKFTRFDPPRERWATIWNDARLIVKMTTPPEELGEAGQTVDPLAEEATG